MMKKRMISLLLAAALCLSLAACARAPEQGRPENSNGGERVPTQTQPAAPSSTDTSSATNPSTAVPTEKPVNTSGNDIPRSGVGAFTEKCLSEFLGDLKGENGVCSPLNIYMALGMLCELTDGESRNQLLELLACSDMDELREELRVLWASANSDTDDLTLLQAASLWLSDEIAYHEETLRCLAETYGAESFSGQMGSADFNRQLRDWVDEQTRHLLENESKELELIPQTVMGLVTTLYLYAKWSNPFEESFTKEQVFYAEQGEQTAPFMHQTSSMAYYEGERFRAVRLPMDGGVGMWILLPDEDSSLQELIERGGAAALLCDTQTQETLEQTRIKLSLPKFDVANGADLIDHLQRLGVSDIFAPDTADFSPLSEEQAYVSEILHAARVKVDEYGCEAAAFTAILMKSAATLKEPIDFVCERPFLFAVTMDGGPILFAGAVNSME